MEFRIIMSSRRLWEVVYSLTGFAGTCCEVQRSFAIGKSLQHAGGGDGFPTTNCVKDFQRAA